MIGEGDRRQFEEEGYFFRQQLLSDAQVGALRTVCDSLIEEFNGSEVVSSEGASHFIDDQIVSRRAADGTIFQANTISHKYDRYFLQNSHQRYAAVRDVIMSGEMAEICAATLGGDAYFHNNQFVIKYPERGGAFSWHQDSGYVSYAHRPYLTIWCAIDAASEDNGTIYVLPYSRAGTRTRVEHVVQPGPNDRIGYFGDDPGIAVALPAGGAAVFSSTMFHRSAPTRSPAMRRAFIIQYVAEPLYTEDGSAVRWFADPILKDGRYIGAA